MNCRSSLTGAARCAARPCLLVLLGLAAIPVAPARPQGTVPRQSPARVLSLGRAPSGFGGPIALTLCYNFVCVVSRWGSPPQPLTEPAGVAIDPTGLIAVANTDQNGIELYNADFASSDCADWLVSLAGSFRQPMGVGFGPDPVADDACILAVADTDDNVVKVFRTNGASFCEFGSSGSGNGEFQQPEGVAVDPKNSHVAVADTVNNRVQVFVYSHNAGCWQWSFTIGPNLAGGQNLNQPRGVAIDPATSNIVVADTGNDRIRVFSATGQLLRSFGSPGSGNGQLESPHGVAVDPSDSDVVVADTGNSRVQVFSSEGVYQCLFGTESGSGQLDQPEGVAVDPNSGNILVADSGHGAIKVFSPAETQVCLQDDNHPNWQLSFSLTTGRFQGRIRGRAFQGRGQVSFGERRHRLRRQGLVNASFDPVRHQGEATVNLPSAGQFRIRDSNTLDSACPG